jgi:hypothetical protein
VSGSAAWSRRLSRQTGVNPRFSEPIGPPFRAGAGLPDDLAGVLALLEREGASRVDRENIATTILTLRTADAVIAGPLSTDDANSPGLLQHLADLARTAYRALRPPRELIVHPAFAQVARRFDFIQLSHQEARALGTGALDLGILGQRLRDLQGETGEFAITCVAGRGLLWADAAWWEIELIDGGGASESVAGAIFCLGWVVARRFRRSGAAQALAYARAVTASAVNRLGQHRPLKSRPRELAVEGSRRGARHHSD